MGCRLLGNMDYALLAIVSMVVLCGGREHDIFELYCIV